MDTMALANEITKALFPETYGKQGITMQQAAELIGARGIIEEVLVRRLAEVQNETPPQG